jgi:hypothetical protein
MANEGHKPHSLEGFPRYFPSLKEIVHYTCNAPTIDILKKHSISCVGIDFGCVNPTEVLRIPVSEYFVAGFSELGDRSQLTLNLENWLKTLE